jgi:hypothetical protein
MSVTNYMFATYTLDVTLADRFRRSKNSCSLIIRTNSAMTRDSTKAVAITFLLLTGRK